MRRFKSLYSHIYHAYRGKKWETEIGYRETWNSTIATLVLLRVRSTAPIHGIIIYRTMMNTMDIYNKKMNDMWEPALWIEPGASAWKVWFVTAWPPRLLHFWRNKMCSWYQLSRMYRDMSPHINAVSFSWLVRYRPILIRHLYLCLSVCYSQAKMKQECKRYVELSWIGALRHFSTMLGYIWLSVSTAGGTNCSWEWTSNLPLATDNYLSWDSSPSGEGRVVSKRDALTTRPRRPHWKRYTCMFKL